MIMKAAKLFKLFIKKELGTCVKITEGEKDVSVEYTDYNDNRVRLTYEIIG